MRVLKPRVFLLFIYQTFIMSATSLQESEQELNSEAPLELSNDDTTLELQEVEVSEDVSTEPESPGVLRTRRHGCWEVYDGAWGSYLRQTDDPEANVVVDAENLKQFKLKEGIHKIPSDLWTRWAKLCFYYVDKVQNSVEVSIRILRSDEDPSKYRFLVPRQKVSGASVRVDSFDESIDIETGEELTEYPPAGWTPVGSSHSHNTMGAFFSGTDDKYELNDPGIHLVVGSVNTTKMTYSIAASVVGSKRRFEMHYNNLIDATWDDSVEFHPKVIDYVDYTTPVSTYSTPSSQNSSYGTYSYSKYNDKDYGNYQEWWREQYGKYFDNEDLNDPYYYNDGSTGNKKTQKLWQVNDVLSDYIKEVSSDQNRLLDLIETLKEHLSDAEVALEILTM